MKIFQRIPPQVAVPAFYAFISIGMLVHFLFGTALGALALAISLYVGAETVLGVEPFSPGELVLWFNGQPEAYKVGLATAAVTLGGFVVAFHTATVSWKQQQQAQLRTQTAGEIEHFFGTTNQLVTDAQLFVESLVEAVNEVQRGSNAREAKFKVDWALSQTREFLSAREQLSQATVQVHRIKGRNYTILCSGWGMPDAFDEAVQALEEIGRKMWIHVPIVDVNNPNYIQEFHNQVNVQECQQFIDCAEKLSGPISMLAGSIRGNLLSPVIGFNLPTYVRLLRERSAFASAVREFYRVMSNR
ncbi:hypothetical protein ACN2MM_09715 [Alkalilimnicola ehrlichii MLHE-1]|uniref:hypothetical protein n=1 Tax=Alkalilimnicola ehrlichii TaxID=351052 RepID=UPI0012EA65E1|nr:hypothetical protein [Alkalilimnicola ehrlichii]